jgi:hypothetical protein
LLKVANEIPEWQGFFAGFLIIEGFLVLTESGYVDLKTTGINIACFIR